MKYCYIIEQYYNDHPDLVKILDVNDTSKHNIRTHLCLDVKFQKNHILIPLRKNLGNPKRKFGLIGFAVPSKSKPNAGLDYRYIMVIRDKKYLRFDSARIPIPQQQIIKNNYETIKREALSYIRGYIKAANKNRVEKVAKYRESSLINFHEELNIFPQTISEAAATIAPQDSNPKDT